MTPDKNDNDRLLAQVEAIFDRRGVTAEERETIVSLLTELLLKGLDTTPPTSTD